MMLVLITVAIVGMGKWGKNLISQFSKICNVKYCYTHTDQSKRLWLKENFPKIKFCNDLQIILKDPQINAIIIATPIYTHYSLAKEALEFNKHVFLEKPISTTTKEGKNLLYIAKKKNLVLFVGNIFLYHPIFKKLQKILEKETLQTLYFDWQKFGSFQESIFYDILVHYLLLSIELVAKPKKIMTQKKLSLITDCDVLSLKVYFSRKIMCFIDINRISRIKKRRIVVKTNKNLYLWDDESLLKFNQKNLFFVEFFKPKTTPLENECKEFLNLLKSTNNCYTNAQKSIEIISIINKYF